MIFEDKVAVITGGGGNIGCLTALRLAREGAVVAICDISRESAGRSADLVEKNGGKALPLVVDVTDSQAVDRAFESVKEQAGRIDIMVHSAGGSARNKMRPLTEQTDEVIREIIGCNLLGGIFFARAAARHMIEQKSGGSIIFVASIVALGGMKGCVEYAASKGGLIAMAKSLAIELGPHRITVNCVSPGLVQRDNKDVSHTNYLGRNGTADEVAALIQFLASDQASFITGQNYVIDGGRSLGLKGS